MIGSDGFKLRKITIEIYRSISNNEIQEFAI